MGGEKKTQPVSVLSLLEKRCSLAFSDGLFWERCAARIALVAPRSHLDYVAFEGGDHRVEGLSAGIC